MRTTLFLDPNKTAFLVSKVNDAGNGKSTLSDPDGKVYSLQPMNTWPAPDQPKFEDRDAGAAGAFEKCDVDNGIATFWYMWQGELQGPVSVAFFLAKQPA